MRTGQPYEIVVKWEEHEFFWSTLLPFVNALYVPNTPSSSIRCIRYGETVAATQLSSLSPGQDAFWTRKNSYPLSRGS